LAFAERAQNNKVSFNNVWFSDEAHFHMWFMRGASCTVNYSMDRHLKKWMARANILWRDSYQWALFKHVA
jgi:hypothetical protein